MSDDFEERLKLSDETLANIEAVEKNYNRLGRKMEFRDKIALAVFNAISGVKTSNRDEELARMEYMDNLNKVICNYDELKPFLNNFFTYQKLNSIDAKDK